MNADSAVATEFPLETTGVALRTIDTVVLEQALREVSDGTMTAPLREVVRVAVDRWGFPGSVGAAEAIFVNSGRYIIEPDPMFSGEIVRPRH